MKTLLTLPRVLLLIAGLSVCLLFTNDLFAQTSEQYTCDDITQVSTETCQLLQAVYETETAYYGLNIRTDVFYLGGDEWFNEERDVWFESETPCSWLGVICEGDNIIGLYTLSNSFTDDVASRLSNLPEITELHFDGDPNVESLINLPHLTALEIYVDSYNVTTLVRLQELPALKKLNIWTMDEQLELPSEIGTLSNLTELQISGAYTLTLPAELSNLTNLETLIIWPGNVVGSSVIRDLPNLTTVDLPADGVDTPILELLTSPNLTDISLDDFRSHEDDIGVVTDEFLEQLTEMDNLSNLTNLTIRSGYVTTIPDTISNFANLRELELDINGATELPATITTLSDLTVLSVRSPITTLPSGIGNLSNLETLELMDSELTELPAEIGNLSNLKTLTVFGARPFNFITPFNLPTEVTNLSNLTDVEIDAGVVAWPETLDNWQNLTRLIVRNSQGNLPDSFTNLTNLQQLEITNNEITKLPDVTGLDLTKLHVSRNRHIKSPPDSYAEENFPNILPSMFTYGYEVDPLPSAIGCPDISEIPEHECLVLTQVDGYEWFETETPCSWQGVTCEGSTITALTMNFWHGSSGMPSDVSNLSNLTELTLPSRSSSADLSRIDDIPNLTTLTVSHSQIGDVPFAFPNLSKLIVDSKLSVRYGETESVLPSWLTPAQFPALTSLTLQNMTFREMVTLEDEIGEMSTLTELIIDDNDRLTAVPSSIVGLTELITLQITANDQLLEIPDTIQEENFPNIASFLVQSPTIHIITSWDEVLVDYGYSYQTDDNVPAVTYPYSEVNSGESLTVYTPPMCDDATNVYLGFTPKQSETPLLVGTVVLPTDIAPSQIVSDTMIVPVDIVTDTSSLYTDMFVGTIEVGEQLAKWAFQDHHIVYDLHIIHDCTNSGVQQVEQIAVIELAIPTAVHLNNMQSLQPPTTAVLITVAVALLSMSTSIQLRRTRK